MRYVVVTRPLATDDDTVLLRRVYEALLRDAPPTTPHKIREAEARVEAGADGSVSIAIAKRLMVGEVPVRVWRQRIEA